MKAGGLQMQSVTATFRNGRIEMDEPVDWPDGTQVEVTPVKPTVAADSSVSAPMIEWPEGFFESIRTDWGDEPFARPPQGEFEQREDW